MRPWWHHPHATSPNPSTIVVVQNGFDEVNRRTSAAKRTASRRKLTRHASE